jgi:hypothetical protein
VARGTRRHHVRNALTRAVFRARSGFQTKPLSAPSFTGRAPIPAPEFSGPNSSRAVVPGTASAIRRIARYGALYSWRRRRRSPRTVGCRTQPSLMCGTCMIDTHSTSSSLAGWSPIHDVAFAGPAAQFSDSAGADSAHSPIAESPVNALPDGCAHQTPRALQRALAPVAALSQQAARGGRT